MSHFDVATKDALSTVMSKNGEPFPGERRQRVNICYKDRYGAWASDPNASFQGSRRGGREGGFGNRNEGRPERQERPEMGDDWRRGGGAPVRRNDNFSRNNDNFSRGGGNDRYEPRQRPAGWGSASGGMPAERKALNLKPKSENAEKSEDKKAEPTIELTPMQKKELEMEKKMAAMSAAGNDNQSDSRNDGERNLGRGSGNYGRGSGNYGNRGGYEDNRRGGYSGRDNDYSGRDNYGTDRRNSNYNDSRGGYNQDSRGGYNDERRGGYNDDRRGGYNDDRRGGYNDDRRGGYNDDRRGGYNDDRRGGYEDRQNSNYGRQDTRNQGGYGRGSYDYRDRVGNNNREDMGRSENPEPSVRKPLNLKKRTDAKPAEPSPSTD